MLTINLSKDILDYIWGWGSFIGVIIIPFLIWYFGSSRAEKLKERKDNIALLDYLIITMN